MDNTKKRILKALKKIMLDKPLEKITIQEICEEAMLTRQTFYHHFKDKFDVVNWYFDSFFDSTFLKIGITATWFTNIETFLTSLQKDQVFFTNAYKYDGQNSLEKHHYKRVYDFYYDFAVMTKKGALSEDEIFCLELYCRGAVFMVANWGRHEMKDSTTHLTELFKISMPDIIMDYLVV